MTSATAKQLSMIANDQLLHVLGGATGLQQCLDGYRYTEFRRGDWHDPKNWLGNFRGWVRGKQTPDAQRGVDAALNDINNGSKTEDNAVKACVLQPAPQ